MRRHIDFARLHNFRDVGGYATADGRTVRWGQLYRSDSLSKLGTDDWDRFAELGIRTVIDLRYPWEIDRAGRVPHYDGLEYHNLSIEHRPYDQPSLTPTVDPGPYLADRFAEVAEDGTAELHQALTLLAAPNAGPTVIHCASGKDRTGLLAALVLTLLGVAEEDVVADFALTERATTRLIDDWKAAHPDQTLTWPGYGQAPAQTMTLFLANLATRHGSVLSYAQTQLTADDALLNGLRANLTVSPAGSA
ncbi:protein-tyrosine phosphatase [Actinokineospora alba]|uniref:Protein-tyrosine phosphatase n=1 Tax=Actinokineospora alba TaxID=504798 RepID=A0A1H0PB97_9PSEU|nr:tyrosine-protein phosphatase [Actinokineospora alba]TDP65719.1 protein-tyrosine phosphatase [Actinokineospora alba]SDI66704.1 protein-tyrosine phosphatase [Actinokineospora alba]SDP02271.1 protein-tyrosine phosphatase [Actinokineospora alba]